MVQDREQPRWQKRLYGVIFEADTALGKGFDVFLIAAILASVLLVMLDRVRSLTAAYGPWMRGAEWTLTILFTFEYAARLLCAPDRRRYATSFFGVVDLLAILPTYAAVIFPEAHYLLAVRVLRILRVFRVFKLAQYLSEASQLRRALVASRRTITVFPFTVSALVVVIGSVMYLVEGEENGFTSIPRAVYWAIVTLTTVGYGDVAPQTPLGQALASLVMVLGYGIIAVPTGIVTAELTRTERELPGACPGCAVTGHLQDALHCRRCGVPLGRA